MLLFGASEAEAQEWKIVQRVVGESIEGEPEAWEALARCANIEAYTDGSAPVRNPGGPAGFAAVLVGFNARVSKSTPERPTPAARLDLGGYIPQRNAAPLTSNNRAEIAGIMAAYEALRRLATMGWAARQVTVWSDSKYAVMCAGGAWKRKKNTDLWPIYDRLAEGVWRAVPGGVALEWVKGHAGNLYNEAADKFATQAAFNFNQEQYARFRAAQAATGREMPGGAVLDEAQDAQSEEEDTPQSIPQRNSSPEPRGWLNEADYALVLHTRMDNKQASAGMGAGTGQYRIWSRDGRSRHAEVAHKGQMLHDEAEYATLIAALSGMVERMDAKGRDPRDFAVTVYSSRELMVKQLTGEYKVKAAALQAPYNEARTLLKRFGHVEFVWKRGPELTALLNEPPV